MTLNFLVKQVWRIKEAYRYFLPLIGIINTFLYFIIAVGVTKLFVLTIPRFIMFILFVFFTFNIIGYVFDKLNLFSKDYAKVFEGMTLSTYVLQTDYLALKIAQLEKLTIEEINDRLEDHVFTKKAKMRTS